jgi:hypothetical protein
LGDKGPSATNQFPIPNTSIMYPVIQFLSLRVAGLFFPENFIKPEHLHLSADGSRIISAMYSDFVSDDSGRTKRSEHYRRMFYDKSKCTTREERNVVRMMGDTREQELCPGLAPLTENVEKAGISLAHPEANYQVSDGHIVFFEIRELDLVAAANYIAENLEDKSSARQMLALTHLVTIKAFASLLLRAITYHNPTLEEWVRTPLPELMRIFSKNYGKSDTFEHMHLVEDGMDIVKAPLNFFTEAMNPTNKDTPQMPMEIDEGIFELI